MEESCSCSNTCHQPALKKVLADRSFLSLRFQLPRDFNDPYELFLQTDKLLPDEAHRAFYDFFFGDVVQAPAVSFSKRPDSVTMWAHYASEGTGVVLGFDEEALASTFRLAYFGDVEYSDQPATVSRALVERAFGTGKRRDGLNVLSAAHRAAFFQKRSDWQYERERRLVVERDAVQKNGELLTVRIPADRVRFLILGQRTSPELRALCTARSQEWSVPLLEFRTGRRHVEPFFAPSTGLPFRWDGTEFDAFKSACSVCGEPTETTEASVCNWCSISADARRVAAGRNMLAATLHFGIDPGVPLEFDGLEAKGTEAAAHMAAMKERRDFPGLEDVQLQLKLYHLMKQAGTTP